MSIQPRVQSQACTWGWCKNLFQKWVCRNVVTSSITYIILRTKCSSILRNICSSLRTWYENLKAYFSIIMVCGYLSILNNLVNVASWIPRVTHCVYLTISPNMWSCVSMDIIVEKLGISYPVVPGLIDNMTKKMTNYGARITINVFTLPHGSGCYERRVKMHTKVHTALTFR